MGTNFRIYPIPTTDTKLFLRIRQYPDPTSPSYKDDTIHGVSNMSNLPFGNVQYNRINSIGRQWIRSYTVAISMEQLGYIRGKFGSIPVPNSDVTLNSSDLITNGRTDRDELKTKLREMLESMTYDKLIEIQSVRSENIQKQLKYVPIPNGRAITIF